MDFSALFPAAPSYFPSLLGEEQARLAQQQAQQQGLLGAALGLLSAGGPSRTPVSFGQSLAQGLQAGQQAYTGALQQRTQESLINRQLQEEQRKKQEQEFMRQLLPLAVQPGEVGSQALSQAAAVMTPDNYAKFVGAIKTQREMTEGPKPELREVGGALYEIARGQPPKLIIDAKGKLSGDFANYAKGLFGTDIVAELPAGGFEQIQKAVIAQKQAGAQPIEVKVGQSGATQLLKSAIERADASEMAASGAVQTIRAISDLKPILSAGVLSGPLSGQAAVVARLASTLGVTGQNTQELLNRTSTAMQRLASLELSAAEQMRGQGAITENERALIARAAGGNLQSLTVGEVNSLLDALGRTAEFKIQSHKANVNRLRKILPEDAKSFIEGYTTDFNLTAGEPEVRQQAGSAARSAGLVR
jgi:hypothetical protein